MGAPRGSPGATIANESTVKEIVVAWRNRRRDEQVQLLETVKSLSADQVSPVLEAWHYFVSMDPEQRLRPIGKCASTRFLWMACLTFPLRQLCRVEHVDDFDSFASYSIDNAVRSFHQFTNAGPFVPVNHTAKAGECC